jgi:hypothetical protein
MRDAPAAFPQRNAFAADVHSFSTSAASRWNRGAQTAANAPWDILAAP